MNKKELLEKITKNINNIPDNKIDGFVLAVSGHNENSLNAFTDLSADIDASQEININGFILTKLVHILLDSMNKYNEEQIFKLMEMVEIPPEILTLYKKMTERTSGCKNQSSLLDCFFIGRREVINARMFQDIYIRHMEYNVSIIAKLKDDTEKRLFIITGDDTMKTDWIAKDLLNKISETIKSKEILDLKKLEKTNVNITLMI